MSNENINNSKKIDKNFLLSVLGLSALLIIAVGLIVFGILIPMIL